MYLAMRFGRARAIGGILGLLSMVTLILVFQGPEVIGIPPFDLGKESQILERDCPLALIPHRGYGKNDRSIARTQRLLQSGKPNPDYLERLGWDFVAKARSDFDPGFYNLAEAAAQCIEQISPGAPSALLLHAHIDNNLHRFKKAETTGRLLVEKRGAWFDYAVYGDALMEQGKLDHAAEAYQVMMNIRPGPQAYLRAAHLRWLTGDLDGATELVEMAIPATSTLDRETAAWIYVRLATYLVQAGKIEESQAFLTRALILDSGYAPALLAQGRIYLTQNRPAKALPLLYKAAERNPLPEYQWVLIEALQLTDQRSEINRRQDILRTRGPVEDRRTYTLYLASSGKADPGLLGLAEKELEVRRDAFTLDAMAWVLYALGDYARASEFINKAAATGIRDARLFLHRGAIASANHHFDEANHWLNQAQGLHRMLLPSETNRLLYELEALHTNRS